MRHFLVLIALPLCFVTNPSSVKAMAQQAEVPGPAANTLAIPAVEVAEPEVKPPIALSIIKSTTLAAPDARSGVAWMRLQDRTARFIPPTQMRTKQNWIKRHPMLFGTLAGFGGGFVIGMAGGDDGVFYDFTAAANGLFVGGIGAPAGALIGFAISR
jgi:hypothetical protein